MHYGLWPSPPNSITFEPTHAEHLQMYPLVAPEARGPCSPETRWKVTFLIDRMVMAVMDAEALPTKDKLRRAHPRERCLEDARLERPELIVGCWASG